jgi:hypothetical protein
VLAVVEHEQELAMFEPLGERVEEGSTRLLAYADRRGDRLRYDRGIG